MNKLFFITAFIFFVISTGISKAQNCVPDAGATGVLTPTPDEGLPQAILPAPYSTTITIKAPKDTTVTVPGLGSTTLDIDSLVLVSIAGLPTGFSYSCEPAPCKWLGNTTGCINISGTPLSAGTFPLTFLIKGYFRFPGGGNFNYDLNEANGYELVIRPANTGVTEIKENQSIKAFPNPSKGEFTIQGKNLTLENVKIYDIRGRAVDFMPLPGSGYDKMQVYLPKSHGGVYFIHVQTKTGIEVISVAVM
jgi:hypothetical protein